MCQLVPRYTTHRHEIEIDHYLPFKLFVSIKEKNRVAWESMWGRSQCDSACTTRRAGLGLSLGWDGFSNGAEMRNLQMSRNKLHVIDSVAIVGHDVGLKCHNLVHITEGDDAICPLARL